MSDEGKDKNKNPKRTFKIKYVKCIICGGRKLEQNMVNANGCNECFGSQEKRKADFLRKVNRGGKNYQK